ncbi:hypothetical protein, partial [Rhodococcus sp. (in: high G+C Gram-positive bacteria)]|uniref:hypothetical protein n=1 Tax=Rhodococcus sp. TaxID=1831 RepID=UPI003F035442
MPDHEADPSVFGPEKLSLNWHFSEFIEGEPIGTGQRGERAPDIPSAPPPLPERRPTRPPAAEDSQEAPFSVVLNLILVHGSDILLCDRDRCERSPRRTGEERTQMNIDDMVMISIDDHVVEPADIFE